MADTQKKGREVPPIEFTFPDVDVTVQIRRISPLLRDDIDSQLRVESPPPEVPIKKRNYGTEEEPDYIEEPDPFDPIYKEAVRKWSITHGNDLGTRLLRIAVMRGVVLELDENQKQEVQQLREDMREVGIELDPDDKFVYITRICVSTNDTLRSLHDAIFTASRPDREVIEAMKATFPSNVQGEGRIQVPSTPRESSVDGVVLVDGGS